MSEGQGQKPSDYLRAQLREAKEQKEAGGHAHAVKDDKVCFLSGKEVLGMCLGAAVIVLMWVSKHVVSRVSAVLYCRSPCVFVQTLSGPGKGAAIPEQPVHSTSTFLHDCF